MTDNRKLSIEQHFLPQLLAAIVEAQQVIKEHQRSGSYIIPIGSFERAISLCQAAVFRAVHPASPHATRLASCLSAPSVNNYVLLQSVLGITLAVESDVRNGYLYTAEELSHAELFSDYLDMADHLLQEGYKDASAVIVGSSLEAHLRQLCHKNGISTEIASASDARAKKADSLNNELRAAGVYEKLDSKNVTAWLDLRNKAAHGKYDEYSKEQVSLMLMGVRMFIQAIPA